MYYNIINLVLLLNVVDREQRNHCVKEEEFDSKELAGGDALSRSCWSTNSTFVMDLGPLFVSLCTQYADDMHILYFHMLMDCWYSIQRTKESRDDKMTGVTNALVMFEKERFDT